MKKLILLPLLAILLSCGPEESTILDTPIIAETFNPVDFINPYNGTYSIKFTSLLYENTPSYCRSTNGEAFFYNHPSVKYAKSNMRLRVHDNYNFNVFFRMNEKGNFYDVQSQYWTDVNGKAVYSTEEFFFTGNIASKDQLINTWYDDLGCSGYWSATKIR